MKRIIICSDGTWNSPEDEQPTNVLRLARAIAPTDSNGIKQVVFYDWGVGSDRKKYTGGISGSGIDKNIQDCYRFIVQNYSSGDELFFFGFSRGAYTVRSLAGLIRNCGILKRKYADRIPSAYRLYRERKPSSHPNKPKSVEFRNRYSVTGNTNINFLGIWDTVGALGIPITFWGLLGNEEYLFHDTSPSNIILCARHALAIDENRKHFPPVRWDVTPNINLKEVWFAGVHSDVGGGYADDHSLSEIPASWLFCEASSQGLKIESYLSTNLKYLPTSMRHDQRKGIYKPFKPVIRKISPTDLIHKSVKLRFQKMKGKWKSPSFRKFFKAHGNDWGNVNIEN